MNFEKEKETGYELPPNFQRKVNAYKDDPPSEEMIKALRRLASGEVPLTIKTEDIFGLPRIPLNPEDMRKFIDKQKNNPPSDDMKKVLKAIASGDRGIISCISLHEFFGDGWTPDVYKRFLKEINIPLEE